MENANGFNIIGQKNENLTLKWNFYGLSLNSYISFERSNGNHYMTIARFKVYSYSTRPEPLETHTTLNTRFLTGSCTFPNQNGSCHITLPNLQYSDGNRYY